VLQSTHLALDPSAAMDNDRHQRHIEKQILPDLKNNEKTMLSI
jgi:hypothetical protein